MRKRIPATIILSLLATSAGAQRVLYENIYNPSGGNNCSYSGACSFPGTVQDAQSFNLTAAATVSSISFIVTDPSTVPVESAYNWSIYAAANGLPTGTPGPTLGGNPTVLPVISGEAFRSNGLGMTYSYENIAYNPANGVDAAYTNEVTINIGGALTPGTYFFAISGLGSSVIPEGWVQGSSSSGAAASNYGLWSALPDSFAMTVVGTAAPEIDPASAMSVLTMLLGGLTVLRSRRAA
jgi:hypothetical protein